MDGDCKGAEREKLSAPTFQQGLKNNTHTANFSVLLMISEQQPRLTFFGKFIRAE